MPECPYCREDFGSDETLVEHVELTHADLNDDFAYVRSRRASEHPVLRFIMKVCAFVVGAGLLGIVAAALLAIFGSHETFPSFQTNPDGSVKPVDFWTYFWQVGAAVVVATVIGGLLWFYLESPEPEDW